MSNRAMRRQILIAAVAVLFLTIPCSAQSGLVQADYRDYPLRLESFKPVMTWEQDGVRVLVAQEGALIRQGPMRLSAARMVVWFDKARSSQPDVRAALVNVYAEGVQAADGRLRQPVRLVEAKQTRSCGAVFMRLTSMLSFVWDCPLEKAAGPVPSVLLARAETITSGLAQDTLWEALPALEVPEPAAVFEAPLKADHTQVFLKGEQATAVYIGDVHGGYEDLELRADAAVQWYDAKTGALEIYARGNVRLSRKPGPPSETGGQGRPTADVGRITDALQFLQADEVYIDPRRNRGLATNVEARMQDPRLEEPVIYVVRGREAYMVDSRTLTVREASGTTCTFARPHYRFAAGTIQVVRQRPSMILNAWDVAFQVGDEAQRSLLKVPFLGTDLTQRAYLLTDYAIGSTSKFGFFVQTTWRPLDLTTAPPWVDSWTVNLDYYSARGPAVGTDLLYRFGQSPYPRHEGELRGYYVRDTADEDDTDLPVPEENRGRVHWQHRFQATRDWRLDAEYYWLSDEGLLNEYFEDEFENQKSPESYLLARYLRGSTYLALLYKSRINDFLTQLEHQPSLDLEIIGVPIGRLVYEGSVVAGSYDPELSDLLPPVVPDPPSLTRAHTEHKVSMPLSVGIFRLDPFVRVLATWTTKSAFAGGSFGGSENRAGAGAGITASTSFSRAFDVSSELFDLNRLRHIVIPHAGFETLSVSGADSADFIPMDAIDAIDSGTQGVVGLRQRLQTKRRRDGRWQSVNWAELDVAYVSRSSDSVMRSLDQDFLRADFEMLLTEHVSLHSRDNRIGLEGQPDLINAGFTLDYLSTWLLNVDYDTISDRNSTITAELNCKLSDRYRLLLLEQFELDSRGQGDSASLETRAVVRRLLDQWVLDVGVHYEKSNDEFALIFGFGPRGWGFYNDRRRAAR